MRLKGAELDQIRTNGQNRTKVDIMDQIESNSTEQINLDHIGPSKTQADRMDRIEPM